MQMPCDMTAPSRGAVWCMLQCGVFAHVCVRGVAAALGAPRAPASQRCLLPPLPPMPPSLISSRRISVSPAPPSHAPRARRRRAWPMFTCPCPSSHASPPHGRCSSSCCRWRIASRTGTSFTALLRPSSQVNSNQGPASWLPSPALSLPRSLSRAPSPSLPLPRALSLAPSPSRSLSRAVSPSLPRGGCHTEFGGPTRAHRRRASPPAAL
jgi:hypothetical protein